MGSVSGVLWPATFLCLLLSSAVAAPPPARPLPAAGAVVEGISEHTLSNGLRVLLVPDPSVATVTVNITYLVGSRHEGYGEAGMAHLLEHMLYKGTRSRKEDVFALLDGRGADFNGTTSYDRTNYFETLAASRDNLAFALALEADRMVNSRMLREDLEKEFSVVRNEFEKGENNPHTVLDERVLSAAYLFHNYGRSVIGSRSDIERVPIDNLRAFYARHYQPDNAVLVVAGAFDPREALELVQASFGPIPRPTRALPRTYTVEPVQDGERTVELRRVGDVPKVSVVYHGLAGADPDFVAEEAVADLLTQKPAGRLYRALVESKLAASVEGWAMTAAEPGVLALGAYLTEGGDARKVREVLLRVIEGLRSEPPTAEELRRFQARALKAIDLGLRDSRRVGLELSEWVAQGDFRLLFLHRDRVRSLTREAVQRFAASYLLAANRTVGIYLPDRAPQRSPQPPAPDVAAMVRGYKGDPAVAQGEAFEATVDNIERRTRRLTLPSGMKVALLPRRTRGGAVALSLQLHFGSQADLAGKRKLAELLGPMLVRGTRRRSFQQIRDELDRLRAELDLGEEGGAFLRPPAVQHELPVQAAGLRMRAVRDTLPEVLALLTEILREPSFPAAEFEIVRKEAISRLETGLHEPVPLALNALQRRLDPYPATDARYVPTMPEALTQLRRLRAAELHALYRALVGGGAATLAIVGDFDAVAVEEALRRGLGDWRAARPYQRVDLPPFPAAAAAETLRTPDKEMAVVVAATAAAVRDDDADYPAMVLGAYALGGSTSARLFLRLRKREGLSYGAAASLSADGFIPRADFLAYAICAPQNARRAQAALDDELARLLRDGLPAAELEEARRSYLRRFQTELASDAAVAVLLSSTLHEGRTLRYYADQNERIARATSADVTRALRRVIDPAKLLRVVAGDVKD